MKKLAIAGASAAVLAAMPVVGVFAAQTPAGSTTDTVEITIENACSLTASGNSAAYAKTMTNGQSDFNIGGTTITIKCNNVAGWDLKAVGFGDDATDKTAMNATGSGTDIPTGSAVTPTSSQWAFKLTGSTVASGYSAFASIPSAETTVASSSVATDAVDGVTVVTRYGVYIDATQQADTYTGKVKYTLYQPHE